jgi:poly-gamma-glutamate synthesis protein (capsule biosynthesis protein)
MSTVVRDDELSLALAGDVMTGRGIDQVLPHPGDPTLYEHYVDTALGYVSLAERANGPIPRPVDFPYVWGDVLDELAARKPDAFVINLETAVTRASAHAEKPVNYRMSPANAPVVAAAGVDCCVLSNNHVLDWGEEGLRETLATLRALGVSTAGAGEDLPEASAPAILPIGSASRVLVFGFASESSGVPSSWAAEEDRPGVNLLPDLSDATVARIAEQVATSKQAGDVAVASIHWGDNWGYEIPNERQRFARALIRTTGVDLVHGHSSHHRQAVELCDGKLILYGCGDFLDDYEGIGGYEPYRGDLVLLYAPTLNAVDGTLRRLAMAPFRIRRFRLERASEGDAEWLCGVMDREARKFGGRVRAASQRELIFEPG